MIVGNQKARKRRWRIGFLVEWFVLVVRRIAGDILPPEGGQRGPLRSTLVDRLQLLRREDRLQLEKVRGRRVDVVTA